MFEIKKMDQNNLTNLDIYKKLHYPFNKSYGTFIYINKKSFTIIGLSLGIGILSYSLLRNQKYKIIKNKIVLFKEHINNWINKSIK